MANRNRAVVEILKLAYEFERSVARPGSEDWFMEAIYEPTKLDQELLRDIIDDQFDLVLLTGNPGDGKSAFLGKLVAEPRVTRSGRQIRVRHDATEPTDSDNRTASALDDLVSFLGPLSDSGWNPERFHEACYVVGINKGLLFRAFLGNLAPFSNLACSVRASLEDPNSVEDPVRLVVVDLNLRSTVTLPLEAETSIFDRILSRIVGSALWEDSECSDCDDSNWCPFLSNAMRLRRGLPRQRLKLLWLVQQLRSERHATIRDMLAALAYILVGHEDMFRLGDDASSEIEHPCLFVERECGAGDPFALFRRVFYNSAFVEEDLYEDHVGLIAGYLPTSAERTYGMAPAVIRDYLTTLDPARGLSNDFWDEIEERTLTNPPRAISRITDVSDRDGFELEKSTFLRIDESLKRISEEFDECEPSDPRYRELLNNYQWISHLLVRVAKRRAFFYSEADTYQLTNFSSLQTFLSVLQCCGSERTEGIEDYETVLWETIPAALLRAEGIIQQEEGAHTIKVKWSDARGGVGAILVLPLGDPVLDAEPREVRYVETSPQRLVFRERTATGPASSLTISLDTFEGIVRLANGYHEGFAGVPRTRQLRNYREALRALSPDEIVIQDFDEPSLLVRIRQRERMQFY